MKKYQIVATMDCKEEESTEKLNDLFAKIIEKLFPAYDAESMDCDTMMKIIYKFYKKYKCQVSYVFFSRGNTDGLSVTIIDNNDDKNKLIVHIYADTLSEGLKKAIVCIYFYIKDKKEK